jgi:hypothetical protein
MLMEIPGLLGEKGNVARWCSRSLGAPPRYLSRQQVEDALGVPASWEREPERAVSAQDATDLLERHDQLADRHVAWRACHASLSPSAG